MNIKKLILLQKDLDAGIEKNHPVKEGEDRIADKYTALVVEIAEFANEGRWFKFWSKNQEPRREAAEHDFFSDEVVRTWDPLLEEYVDGLHFFISIAISKGWEDILNIPEGWLLEVEEKGFKGGLTGAFNEVIYLLMKSHHEWHGKKLMFQKAWHVFVVIGLVGFELDEKEIEAAYESKNKENHNRQQNGY